MDESKFISSRKVVLRVYLYVLISFFLGLPPFQPLEREFERRLMEGENPPESTRVRIKASRLGFLFLGICKYVKVDITGLKVPGLRADRFTVEMRGLKFRPFSTFVLGKARLRDAEDIHWKIKLLDEDLERFLKKRSPVLSFIQVRIDEKCVSLHQPAGIAAIFAIPEAFTIKGRLELNEKKDVLLCLDHFSAFGVNPGKAFWSAVAGVVNPIIKSADINRMLARNQIEALENAKPQTGFSEIVLETGHAIISGKVFLVKTEAKQETPEVEKRREKSLVKKAAARNQAKESRRKKVTERQEESPRRRTASEPQE